MVNSQGENTEMNPSAANFTELQELVDHCSAFVDELQTLERTVSQYTWFVEQERQELTFLGSTIASLEIAVFTQEARSTAPVPCL